MTDPAPLQYVTTDDVRNVTGSTVTDAQILIAQSCVEMASNRTIEASGYMHSRDLVWMKRAVCYQAAYVTANPEIFTRQDISNISQDGWSVTWKDGSGSTWMSMLAAKALSRLSWQRVRSVSINSDFQYGRSQSVPGWFQIYDDDAYAWSPLAGD